MAKRVGIEKFVEMLSMSPLGGKEVKKNAIQNFAVAKDVSVPTVFWKEYKVGRGVYRVEKAASTEESIASEETVNQTVDKNLPDDEFEIEVKNPHDSEIVKVIRVRDLTNGNEMRTSIAANASEERVRAVVEHYKFRLRYY